MKIEPLEFGAARSEEVRGIVETMHAMTWRLRWGCDERS